MNVRRQSCGENDATRARPATRRRIDEDSVVVEPADGHPPAARHRHEERARRIASKREPALEGAEGAAGRVDEALAVALAEDADRAARVDVGEIEPGSLGAAEAGAVKQGEERRVAGAARRAHVALGEERPELARGEGAPARQALAADALDAGGELVVVEPDETEPTRGAQHAAERGEEAVRRRRRVAVL